MIDGSWQKVSLKCTNSHNTLYKRTNKVSENIKGDKLQCPCGIKQNLNCGTISNDMSTSICTNSAKSNIFIPMGSYVIPLHYQRDAWEALEYLKASKKKSYLRFQKFVKRESLFDEVA